MNAFSCSSGFCWLADIAFACSFSDPDFTLHKSLLTADMHEWWVRPSWWYSRKPSGGVDFRGCAPVITPGAMTFARRVLPIEEVPLCGAHH